MKFGTGSNNELTQKYETVKVQNDIRTSKHPRFSIVLPLRVCRSLANYTYTVKGFQYHSNNSLQLFELKENNNNKTIHAI